MTDVPSVDEVRRIAAIANPVIRNLEITYCYSRLAAAFAARSGEGANWCTYATWASRQAGRTIRGEDLLEQLGAQARGRPLAAASDCDALASAAAPRPLPARDADRAPDGCAAHAVRRVRACQRRRRAREPEGVRGDRARVRALSPRVPAGRAAESPRSSVSSTDCGPATRPRDSATCARRSRGTSGGGSSAIRRRARSSPSLRTSRSASTSRRACSRRFARLWTPRTPHRRIWGGERSRLSSRRQRAGGRSSGDRPPPSSASWRQAIAASASRLAREVITDVVHGPVAAGAGAGARDAPDRRVPGGARRARRRGADRAAGAVRAGCAGRRRLRRARLVGSSTSGCTTSCTCSARST